MTESMRNTVELRPVVRSAEGAELRFLVLLRQAVKAPRGISCPCSLLFPCSGFQVARPLKSQEKNSEVFGGAVVLASRGWPFWAVNEESRQSIANKR